MWQCLKIDLLPHKTRIRQKNTIRTTQNRTFNIILPRLPSQASPTQRLACFSDLDDRITRDLDNGTAQHEVAQGLKLGSTMSTKFFIIVQESCKDVASLKELSDAITKHDSKFYFTYTRGAMEKHYNSDLYSIRNPKNPNVSVLHQHLICGVIYISNRCIFIQT